MRKMLNILYITKPDAYLSRDGQDIVVSVNKEETCRIPILNIEGIVTFGYPGASPGLMKLCNDNNVSLTFLSPQGKFIARLQGPTKGNVLLRKQQYLISDDKQKALHISRLMIAGKIQNSRNILRRFIRDYGPNTDVEIAAKQLNLSKEKALSAASIDDLRGEEGAAANTYFGVFNQLIIAQKDGFNFNGRNRRPPRDPTNAMLSFAYTLLANECSSALETVGLDPYVGMMHTLRPGRASFALDIMEEMRAYLCDRLVLSLINRKQVQAKDFTSQGEDSILMKDTCRKTLIGAWQQRKKELITHPFLKEKIPVGLLPYAQALLMARYIRGDLNDYPVFLVQ